MDIFATILGILKAFAVFEATFIGAIVLLIFYIFGMILGLLLIKKGKLIFIILWVVLGLILLGAPLAIIFGI